MKVLSLVLCLLSSTAFATQIQIIGYDGDDQVKSIKVKDYQKLIEVSEQAFERYVEENFNSLIESSQEQNSSLRLRKIDLGIGMNAEIGIGPISLELGTRQRFTFKR